MKKLLALVLALVFVLSFAACSSGDAKTIKVGATPAPHAEILEVAKDILAKEGYTLEIVEFTDYVLPNEALNSGDIDANFFQHQPYLTNYNENNGTDLVSAGLIHYEPLGIYPGKLQTLDQITNGTTIAVPNDGSNEARALYLLQDLGYLTVDSTKGFEVTVLDIVDNPLGLVITEVAAEQIPQLLPDFDFGIINGNYAIGAGIDDQILAAEDKESDAAITYANLVAVKAGHENDEKIVALVKAVQSEEVRAFIEESYGVAVVPMF